MSTKTIPKHILDYIPKFDGTSNKITKFIKPLQDIFSIYCSTEINQTQRDENHWLLYTAATHNLEGAADNVVSNSECSNIVELIELLTKSFSDKRTVPDLIAEIAVMRAFQHENPLDFFNRLSDMRTRVVTRYKLDGVGGDLLKNLLEQLDMTLVRTSIHGVHPTLGAHLQVFKHKNLDDARDTLRSNCSIVLKQLKYAEGMCEFQSRNFSQSRPVFNHFCPQPFGQQHLFPFNQNRFQQPQQIQFQQPQHANLVPFNSKFQQSQIQNFQQKPFTNNFRNFQGGAQNNKDEQLARNPEAIQKRPFKLHPNRVKRPRKTVNRKKKVLFVTGRDGTAHNSPVADPSSAL